MNENDKTNLDIDVYSLTNSLVESEDESVFYIRVAKDGVHVGYSGLDSHLISGLITCMNNYKETYDIISTALELFESDAIIIED